MARIDEILGSYARLAAIPWDPKLAGPQRVWFAVYDKADERRLRARVGDFELKTVQSGHGWHAFDFRDAFARWMAGQPYRDEYFRDPESLASALGEFREFAAADLRAVLGRPPQAENAVVAVMGLAWLFGFLRVSELVRDVESDIRGRMLVFFPGEHEKNNYRLLDARDGWNYLATPITSAHGAPSE